MKLIEFLIIGLVVFFFLSLLVSAGLKRKIKILKKGDKYNGFFTDFLFPLISTNILCQEFIPIFIIENKSNLLIKNTTKQVNLILCFFYIDLISIILIINYLPNKILRIRKKLNNLRKSKMTRPNLKRSKKINNNHNQNKMKIKNNKIRSLKKRRTYNKIQSQINQIRLE